MDTVVVDLTVSPDGFIAGVGTSALRNPQARDQEAMMRCLFLLSILNTPADVVTVSVTE